MRRYCTYCITKGHTEIQEIVKSLEQHKDFVQDLGTFTAQRPSTAACKAYTQLRRRNKVTVGTKTVGTETVGTEPQGKDPITSAYIFVKLAMSERRGHLFEVCYSQVEDALLGPIKRPCAKLVVL